MRIDEVGRCAETLEGLRRSQRNGMAEWRYQGRLVVRQLDDTQIVIRCEFGYREALLRASPETFNVPAHLAKHMMVVATLAGADRVAIEDAIEAAWQLQRSARR